MFIQKTNEIKLHLEECGFVTYSHGNVLFKNKTEFWFDPIYPERRIMFRNTNIHNLRLVFGGNVLLSYDRINLLYNFIEDQYQESLKFRKERIKEDQKLDMNLDMSKDRVCLARIAFVANRFLTSFLSLDLEKLDYKIIYKWHNRYVDGLDFNHAIHDEWNNINQ